jgi:ABC-type multidrug transport system ATPase subunit
VTGARPTATTQIAHGPGDGIEIAVSGLSKTVRGDRRVLQDISLTIRAGELVAIVGGSGAGKTTLLEALAGSRPADTGRVSFDSVDLYQNLDAFRAQLGSVPQDDIIHAELPLVQTLRYAARLRLPPSVTRDDTDARIKDVLEALDLTARAGVRVGALSGGQRKRASIAVGLLTRPRAFFVDEPTSGLDPETAFDLTRLLRDLADAGSTIVFTTHAVPDLTVCDRVIFLARDGHLAFFGSVVEAVRYFNVERVEEIYGLIAREATPEEWSRRFRHHRGDDGVDVSQASPERLDMRPAGARAGFIRQWLALTQRTFETLVRNPLTMAILLGSPAMVVAMFAILFRPGAFNFDDPNPNAIAMILFWVTFGAFFFGLTYGLLQIVTEQAILRREHLVGQRLSAYLLSKITVLLPFLLFVVVLMLVVLRALDRLPSACTTTYASVGLTLALDATAALALGLMASALVSNPSQATLALPMLCFPAVLFSGSILPVEQMADSGAVLAALMPDRWAFEAVGRDFGVRDILQHGGSPLGPPLLEAYGDAGTQSTAVYWLYLSIFVVVFVAGAWLALVYRSRQAMR